MKENIEIVNAFYKNISKGDLQGLIDLLSHNITWKLIGPTTIPYFGKYNGREGVMNFFERLFGAEEIINFSPTTFINGGDYISVLGNEKCKSRTTGRVFEAEWVHVFKLSNGQIEEWTEYIDTSAVEAAYQ